MGSVAGQIAVGAALVGASFIPGLNVAVAGALFSAGIGIGLGAASAALAPKPPEPAKPGAVNRAIRSSTAFEQIVYGEARVGGAMVAIDRHTVQRSGPDADYLDIVLVVCARPIDGFETGIFLGDEYVPLEVNGTVKNVRDDYIPSTMYRPLTDSKYYKYVGVNFYDGTQVAADQFMIDRKEDVGGENKATKLQWTEDHKLLGYAYAVVTLRYKQDIWPAGIPNISFLLRGVSVFDPRTSTTVYTANAALCAADYLASEYGPAGVGYAEIDTDALIAAANVCDEEVDHALEGVVIPGLDPELTEVTEARYELSAVVTAEEDWRQVAPRLAMAMAGDIYRVGASWRLVAGAPAASTLSLGPDDMVGELDVAPRRMRRDLYNRISTLTRNRHQLFQVLEAGVIAPARYLDQDNGIILPHEIDASAVVASPTQAVRIASITLEQNRQQITARGLFKYRALTVAPGDVVLISSERLGWDEKPFRVTYWDLDFEKGVTLGLAEYCAGVYAWPPDEALLDCSPDTAFPPPFSTSQATNLAVVRRWGTDSTISWSAAGNSPTGYSLRYKPVGEWPADGYGFGNGTWIALETDPAWTVESLSGVAVSFDADLTGRFVYRVELRALYPDDVSGDWVGLNSFPVPAS